MTSLDKALIKVYEHGHAPKKRRSVESRQKLPARELYVDPPTDIPPSPTIAPQDMVLDLQERMDEPAEHDSPVELASPTSASFVMGDLSASLESFVIHQDFDIPVLDETDPVVADREVASEEPLASVDCQFDPAWEVDSFELSDSVLRMNDELGEQLDDFVAHLRRTVGEYKKLVTVHSLSRGEGRTTLSIALSRALAQSGAKVLLVDSDFEKPALANHVGLAVEIGWEKAIVGEVPITECSIRSMSDAFTVLPLADTATGEDHSILRDALRNLLVELLASFDLILIDTGPGQPVLGKFFDNMIATRIAVRDVRRTDSRLMLQFMSSLKTNADQTIEAIDNFA